MANTLRWRDLAKPTIAGVHGMCIYGGWMIASAMDLIVASDDARFLPAHFQYFSVPWDLGPRKTKELLWKAEFVTADDALELGFVNHVVPRAELDDAVDELAGRIARQDPFVASMIKRSVNEMQDHMGFRSAITRRPRHLHAGSRGQERWCRQARKARFVGCRRWPAPCATRPNRKPTTMTRTTDR